MDMQLSLKPPIKSVKIDNFQSDWGSVNAGVPQGTKIGTGIIQYYDQRS